MSDPAKNDQKKKKKSKRLSNEYQTPEYITVDVTDPITHEENGKPLYTTYKISTQVCFCPLLC